MKLAAALPPNTAADGFRLDGCEPEYYGHMKPEDMMKNFAELEGDRAPIAEQ